MRISATVVNIGGISKGLKQILLAALFLPTVSIAALADPAALFCDWNGGPSVVQSESTIIQLDEPTSVVRVHFPTYIIFAPGYSAAHVAAISIGPLQALFGNDMVTFRNNGLGESYPNARGLFSLNRVTGDFVNRRTNYKWACHSSRKKL
jgi:hypothetical protein